MSTCLPPLRVDVDGEVVDVFAVDVVDSLEYLEPHERVQFVDMIREQWCLSCGDEQPERGCCQCENDE